MELYLGHVSQNRIAATLGISQPTVSRDILVIKDEWKAQRLVRLDDHRDRELQELDRMEGDAIRAALSCDTGSDDHRKWLETRLKIKQRRAKLLGLDAERLHTIKVEGGDNPIQTQVLHAHIDMSRLDDTTLYKLAKYGNRDAKNK